MHEEVLTLEQKKLFPLLEKFSPQFGLVGGTAVALQLGHRRSVDFDLFTLEDFEQDSVKEVIRDRYHIQNVSVERPNELTLFVDSVKMTFYKYPFRIVFSEKLPGIIAMPDILTLGAMKAFSLGRRAKWKDYVDLFFISEEIDYLKGFETPDEKIKQALTKASLFKG
ncbi:MAG: hypothetical protein ACOYT7_00245 [Patescibacteria group bacterium]